MITAGTLFGPDCSNFQGHPDWAKVKASGCLVGGYKVSEGRTFQDAAHQYNRAAVPAAGLIPLAYHFLYYDASYADRPDLFAAQAAWFCSLADPDALHVLDVEAPAPAGKMDVKAWVAEYRRRMPGHALGLYANHSLWANRSGIQYSPAGLFDYLWHAGIGDGVYTTATGTIQAEWGAVSALHNSFAGRGFDTCRLWQITDHAAVAGVSGGCDGNAFQGSADDFRALITTGDDMPTADEIAAAVWKYAIKSQWNAQTLSAAALLARTELFSIEGGWLGSDPAGSPTVASKSAAAVKAVSGQTDSLEASAHATLAAIAAAALDPDALASKVAAKVLAGAGSLDEAAVKAAFLEVLAEELPRIHVVVDPPAS